MPGNQQKHKIRNQWIKINNPETGFDYWTNYQGDVLFHLGLSLGKWSRRKLGLTLMPKNSLVERCEIYSQGYYSQHHQRLQDPFWHYRISLSWVQGMSSPKQTIKGDLIMPVLWSSSNLRHCAVWDLHLCYDPVLLCLPLFPLCISYLLSFLLSFL